MIFLAPLSFLLIAGLSACNAKSSSQSSEESKSEVISSDSSSIKSVESSSSTISKSEQPSKPDTPSSIHPSETSDSTSQEQSIEESSMNTGSSKSSSSSSSYIPQEDDIHVTAVYLNYDSASVYVGKTLSLNVTIEPENATCTDVTWASSNIDVATVSDGKVKGIAAGTTTITATSVDGGLQASCEFTVSINSEEIDDYVPNVDDNNIYFITNDTLSKGTYDSANNEYTFAINSNYKQIYVNAPDKTIIVELNGVTLQNGDNSPIYVADCDTIEISAKKNTVNSIKDVRDAYVSDEVDQGKGAIYVANGDLKLKGTGTLNIEAGYYNGIHGKDDVKIQKETLNISAIHHGVKGNDSVTIISGTVNISCGGDGIHTENTDISSKGNQRGNVTISGGTVNINSWGDAVAASYNAIVEEADATAPTSLTIRTNKYSSYTGETVETSSSVFYIKMNSSTYSNNSYTYAANINGNWYKATYKGTQSSGGMGGGPGGGPGGRPGGSSTYYLYEIEKPSGATSFTLYRFQGSNVTSFSTESYNAVGDPKAFNDAYDTVQISVSGNKISFSSWSNYSSGDTNSADISAKGLKAENEVIISAGTVDIKAYDDAIHANNDSTLDNGSSPLGNVTISGGNITLNASDDAIHADYTLSITGGNTEITSAYEGLEANLVKINGGQTYVYATDDGVNATSGKSSPNVTVSGGLLDVAVPASGDTDGIDSNGTYTQTGGVVITKGPGSASGSGGGGAFALDTDGAVSLSNGTLIVFGGIERTPTTSLTKTLCSSSTVSSGSHSITFAASNTTYATTLKNSTNGCVVYSSLGTAILS